jgi:prolipoprotein diacylglyceryltransferase
VAPLAAVPSTITFAFPATFALAGLAVRWETVVGALGLLVALLLAAAIARRTPLDVSQATDAPSPDPTDGGENHLRADDLLYIAVAALPGAIAGGRLGYAVLHLDYYRANPSALLDYTTGGLELSMGVVGGTLTAATVAALLGAPLGRWLHALAVPLVVLLGLIKLAMVFGGSGQGMPTDVSVATRYLGAGPWGSLGPDVLSWPAQAMEALATVLAGALAWFFMAVGVFQRRNGASFFLAVGLWAVARALVATTWRDPAVVGTLSAGQLLALGLAAACAVIVLAFAVAATVERVRGDDDADDDDEEDPVAWPER